MRIRNVDIGVIRSRKYGADEDEWIRSVNGKLVRFGRCWWYWLPSMHWNGGRFWRGQCLDASAMFLCFSLNLTVWP
jgi:hypothetical protein